MKVPLRGGRDCQATRFCLNEDMAVVEVESVTKRWSTGRLALDAVSLQLRQGEILGLLGHNGAGKSTLMGILLGMVRPDAGSVRVAGHCIERDKVAALGRVGAIYEAPAFYDYLTGMQNLRALTALSGWWKPREVERVVAMVGLSQRVHHRVGTYSHGMRQRLALAQALLPMPKCLLLDEPTDGLDPEGIVEWRELLLRLRAEHGLSILLNSHLLSEVAQLCDRCVILRQGSKVYEGEVRLRQRKDHAQAYVLRGPDVILIRQVCHQAACSWDETSGVVNLPEHLSGADLLRRLVEAGARIEHWVVHQASLEELYLSLSKS